MSDLSPSLPPVPSGPVVAPAPSPRHGFYVVHTPYPLAVNGKQFARGDVMSGADALAFEVAVAKGERHHNDATAVARDPRV